MQKQILNNTDTRRSVIGFHDTRCSASCFVSVYSGFYILCSVLRFVGITAPAILHSVRQDILRFCFSSCRRVLLPPCTLFQFLFTPGYPYGGNFTLCPQRYTHSDFCSIFRTLSQLLKPLSTFKTSLNFRTLSTPSTTPLPLLHLTTTPSTFLSLITLPLP